MITTLAIKVLPEDQRPAGRTGECFYCRKPVGADHEYDCVIRVGRIFDDYPPFVWLPIESLPDGFHVALFFPEGERGIGGIETATVFRNEGEWSYWTHGGPNSGVDWDSDERPTMWMKLTPPAPPTD